MKFKESDTGNEYHYNQFSGIEFAPRGEWSEDYNNNPPSDEQYREWFYSVHPKPVDVDTGWIDAKCFGEGSTQHQDPTRNSYMPSVGLDPIPNIQTATLTKKTLRTGDRYIACT